MADSTGDQVPKSDVERAREQERLHRRLQHQGDTDRGDERPPAQRERDEAIDAATEDVERVLKQAHGTDVQHESDKTAD